MTSLTKHIFKKIPSENKHDLFIILDSNKYTKNYQNCKSYSKNQLPSQSQERHSQKSIGLSTLLSLQNDEQFFSQDIKISKINKRVNNKSRKEDAQGQIKLRRKGDNIKSQVQQMRLKRQIFQKKMSKTFKEIDRRQNMKRKHYNQQQTINPKTNQNIQSQRDHQQYYLPSANQSNYLENEININYKRQSGQQRFKSSKYDSSSDKNIQKDERMSERSIQQSGLSSQNCQKYSKRQKQNFYSYCQSSNYGAQKSNFKYSSSLASSSKRSNQSHLSSKQNQNHQNIKIYSYTPLTNLKKPKDKFLSYLQTQILTLKYQKLIKYVHNFKYKWLIKNMNVIIDLNKIIKRQNKKLKGLIFIEWKRYTKEMEKKNVMIETIKRRLDEKRSLNEKVLIEKREVLLQQRNSKNNNIDSYQIVNPNIENRQQQQQQSHNLKNENPKSYQTQFKKSTSLKIKQNNYQDRIIQSPIAISQNTFQPSIKQPINSIPSSCNKNSSVKEMAPFSISNNKNSCNSKLQKPQPTRDHEYSKENVVHPHEASIYLQQISPIKQKYQLNQLSYYKCFTEQKQQNAQLFLNLQQFDVKEQDNMKVIKRKKDQKQLQSSYEYIK